MQAFSRLVYLVFYLLLSMIAGCGQNPAPGAANKPAGAWDKELFFGVIPIESEARTRERYARFMGYLEQRLGSQITLVVPQDYAGVIDGLAQKKLHFALLGPKSYVEASKRAKIVSAVRMLGMEGENGYKGIIITLKTSGLNNLSDLKGKSWAFTDQNSTSGNLIPSVYFAAEAQIDPTSYFSKVVFSGNHEKSILMVKNGEIDAAATNNVDLARDSGRNWHQEDFNIIWESQLIPHDTLVYQRDIATELQQAFIQAALAYDDAEGLKDMAISKFIPSQDEDYVFVRQLEAFRETMQKSAQ